MTRKSAAGLLLAGVLVGAIAMALVQRTGEADDSGALPAVESTDQITALRAEYDRRISRLTAENEALQADKNALEKAAAENTVGSKPPRLLTDEERRKVSEEFRQRNIAAARERKTAYLLAAGYSMDQIERLQRRADELAKQFRESQADQMARGVWPLDKKKDFVLAAVLGVDPTFALKYEIGDAEYERYLAAQKRPTTVHVSGVSKGSVAASAGIMPGDEIVTYDNERIFNNVQLGGVAAQRSTDPGGRVPVTVRRDGQMLQLMVPKGPIDLGINLPLSDVIDLDALSHMPPVPPPPLN